MSDMSLGTISATVALNLSALAAGVAETTATMTELASSLKATMGEIAASTAAQTEAMTAKLAQSQSRALATAQARQEAAAEKALAAEKAMGEKRLALMDKVSGKMLLAGGVIAGVLGEGVKVGADFEAMMNSVANNTSLTTEEVAKMRETVIALGRESGASLEQLAKGFARITNFGFKAAEAPLLLREAMKAAVSTGADVEKTAQVLAATMHEFGMQTGQAANVMNVLRTAAQDGNSTLEQFTEGASQAYAMAANLGASFTDVTAAMVALTRHGFSVSEAATQIKNVFVHIAEPGNAVEKILDAVSKKSGVDLVKAFQTAALSGHGMQETLDKIRDAAKKAGINADDLMMRLIHAMRGGLGAMVLAKTGAADFKEEIKKLNDTMAGKLDPGTAQYKKTLGTLDQQVKIAKNNMTLMADDIQKALLPAINSVVTWIGNAAKSFGQLSSEEKESQIKFVAWVGAALLVVGAAGKIVTAIAEFRTALVTLGITAEATGAAVGASFTAMLGPIALAASAISGLILLAKTAVIDIPHDIDRANKIRFNAAEAKTDSDPAYLQKRNAFLREAHKKNLDSQKEYSFSPAKVEQLQKEQAGIELEWRRNLGNLEALHDKHSSANAALQAKRQAEAEARKAAAAAAKIGKGGGAGGGMNVRDFMGGLPDDDAGGKTAKKAKKSADELRDAAKQFQDALFAMTHSEDDVKRRDAAAQYDEDRKNPYIGKVAALKRYTETMAQIHNAAFGRKFEQEAEEEGQRAATAAEQKKSAWQATADAARKFVADLNETFERQKAQKDLQGQAKAAGQSEFANQRDAAKQNFETNRWVDANAAAVVYKATLAKIAQAESQEFAERGAALTEAYALQEQEKARAVDAEVEQIARVNRYEYEQDELSAADYQDYLQTRLALTKQYTEEWFTLMAEQARVTQSEAEKQAGGWKAVLSNMKQNATDILGNALGNAFDHGFKHFFKDVLKGFEDMLKQMLARAIAMGVINLLTGGAGGFMGKAGVGAGGKGGGFLSAFGFDDMANDRAAKRWGYDWAGQFSSGVSDARRGSNAVSPGGGRSIHAPTIVNMHDTVIREEADIDRIGQAVSWHAQQRLKVV